MQSGGSQPLLPWFMFTLLASAVIVGGGLVVRRADRVSR
jgi:hypothetical protein